MTDLPTPSYSYFVRGRSLEEITVALNEAGDLVLSCFCDCATTTDVVLVGGKAPTTDFSYTCDGCLSVHWLAVKEADAA